MRGLVPRIHVGRRRTRYRTKAVFFSHTVSRWPDVDARDERGHDDWGMNESESVLAANQPIVTSALRFAERWTASTGQSRVNPRIKSGAAMTY